MRKGTRHGCGDELRSFCSSSVKASGSTLPSMRPWISVRTLRATGARCSLASFSSVAKKFLHLVLADSADMVCCRTEGMKVEDGIPFATEGNNNYKHNHNTVNKWRGLTEPTEVAWDACVTGVGVTAVAWVGTTVVPATVVPGATATVVGAVMAGTACVAMEVVVVAEESATVFCGGTAWRGLVLCCVVVSCCKTA